MIRLGRFPTIAPIAAAALNIARALLGAITSPRRVCVAPSIPAAVLRPSIVRSGVPAVFLLHAPASSSASSSAPPRVATAAAPPRPVLLTQCAALRRRNLVAIQLEVLVVSPWPRVVRAHCLVATALAAPAAFAGLALSALGGVPTVLALGILPVVVKKIPDVSRHLHLGNFFLGRGLDQLRLLWLLRFWSRLGVGGRLRLHVCLHELRPCRSGFRSGTLGRQWFAGFGVNRRRCFLRGV
mmetsp:Transcript_86927/g.243610  ORF Transcript_86927/g.243610 Transcript_86927/m.243610 type:complete len:240 (-) Transcript_86927:174-893(-)